MLILPKHNIIAIKDIKNVFSIFLNSIIYHTVESENVIAS